MNERIKKLLQERPDPIGYIGNWGRVQWKENVYPQLGDDLYAGVDLEKFAELIVRECSKIAEEYDGAKLSGPGMIIAARIETHFGVEE